MRRPSLPFSAIGSNPRKIRCDKCGLESGMPGVHTLPDGWEQWGYGDNICPRCRVEMMRSLKRYKKHLDV
jgi:hypothetical protein